jgi:hypothetical protein
MVMNISSGKYKWFVILFFSSHIFFRPNGKITSLDIPDLQKKFIVVRYPSSHPEQARFISSVLSKEDLYQDFFHYYITQASSLKRCASCHQQFGNVLSIQTTIVCIFNPVISQITSKGNVRAKVAFCMNDKCLSIWLNTTTWVHYTTMLTY